MKQTRDGFMFMEFEHDWSHDDWEKKWRPAWLTFRPDDCKVRVFVREMSIEFSVPDDFDPIPQQVAALAEEKREALAEYQRKVADINEQLSKLQALTFEEPA